MFQIEYILAGIILVALIIYTLSGGADFGGGVWDLLAMGDRNQVQRKLISSAIGPIWEANHVWLIVIVVLLFVCFPVVYTTVSTVLFIPLVIMLIGIVLRGSAFAFRSHDEGYKKAQKGWGTVFAISSIVTPLMLGICLGTLATGQIQIDPVTHTVQTDFFSEWLQRFPLTMGVFNLVICAFLSALYLIFETADSLLKQDFRQRALLSGIFMQIIALVGLYFSKNEASEIYQGILEAPWSIPLMLLIGCLGLGSVLCLFFKKDFVATALGMAQVAAFIISFGLALFPYFIVPNITILEAAAPQSILQPVLIALGLGAIALVPAFGWLYYTFKGNRNSVISTHKHQNF